MEASGFSNYEPSRLMLESDPNPLDANQDVGRVALYGPDGQPILVNQSQLDDAIGTSAVTEGMIRVAKGGGQFEWTDALDRLPIPGYGASDLVCGAPLPNLFSANGVPGATNRLNLTRVIAPRMGKLRNLYFPVSAVPASGVFEAGVYDVNGFRLWTTGQQTAATFLANTGWKRLGDPKIDIDSGEPLFYAWVNDTNLVGSYRYPVGNAVGVDLPFDLMPEGNGKVCAYLPGQTSLPAYIDPNSFIASTLCWAMIGKVVG